MGTFHRIQFFNCSNKGIRQPRRPEIEVWGDFPISNKAKLFLWEEFVEMGLPQDNCIKLPLFRAATLPKHTEQGNQSSHKEAPPIVQNIPISLSTTKSWKLFCCIGGYGNSAVIITMLRRKKRFLYKSERSFGTSQNITENSNFTARNKPSWNNITSKAQHKPKNHGGKNLKSFWAGEKK